MTYKSHPTAIIDEGATIGKNCSIWHFSHICKGAKIGDNVSIGQNVFVGNRVAIGNNCKIQNNVSVYDEVTLEDKVFCGPSMVFTNVYNPRAHISRKDEYKKTLVKKGATIGANATIVCGVTLGEFCFIGAGSLINRNIPPFAIAVGVPYKIIGWMCKCGNKLKSDELVKCSFCQERYKINENGCVII